MSVSLTINDIANIPSIYILCSESGQSHLLNFCNITSLGAEYFMKILREEVGSFSMQKVHKSGI